MSVLLRQADGFEGLGPRSNQSPVHGLSVEERPYMPCRPIDLNAAALPAPVEAHSHNNMIAFGEALLDLRAGVLELLLVWGAAARGSPIKGQWS